MHEDCESILFAFVSECVVDKNLNTPNWCSVADNTIIQGGIGILGSLFYTCDQYERHVFVILNGKFDEGRSLA